MPAVSFPFRLQSWRLSLTKQPPPFFMGYLEKKSTPNDWLTCFSIISHYHEMCEIRGKRKKVCSMTNTTETLSDGKNKSSTGKREWSLLSEITQMNLQDEEGISSDDDSRIDGPFSSLSLSPFFKPVKLTVLPLSQDFAKKNFSRIAIQPLRSPNETTAPSV